MTEPLIRTLKFLWPLDVTDGGFLTADDLTSQIQDRFPDAEAVATTIDNERRCFVTCATIPNEAR